MSRQKSLLGVSVATEESNLRSRFEEEALPLMGSLYAGAMQLTRNPGDAEDLVQDTYVRSFQKFHLYKPGTKLRAWMHRIMVNRFINLYRRRKNSPESASFDDLHEFIGKEDTQALSDYQSAEVLHGLMQNDGFLESLDSRLKDALENLGDEYREVLILNVIGEMAYREIASELSIPVGTVMSRLSRAKSILREKVAELGEEVVPG